MALPFLVESTPRAYGLKAGNAALPISTAYGTFPRFTSPSDDAHNSSVASIDAPDIP